MIACMLEHPGQPDIKPIFFNLNMPHADMKPKTEKFILQELKRFIQQFQIDVSSGTIDPNMIKGAEAECTLIEIHDPKWGHKNELSLDPIS